MTANSLFTLGLLAAALLVPTTVSADDGDVEGRITVIGQGEVKAVPDIATMAIGVETEAKTPSAALSENAADMTAVMARLAKAGIAEKDMQTSQLGIWPIYAENSGSSGRRPGKIDGYRATNQLTVTMRDIDRIGETLDQAVADGANSVNGPRFSVADAEPLYQAARDAAVKDAIAKARRYAAAADVELGDIVSISEGGGGPIVAPYMRAEAMAASTPVAAGENTFTASVSIVFEID
ncbi:MAG: SIMPL domain-containing protein [Geminicoccaceae bacterium]